MENFDSFYENITAQKEKILALKGQVKDPMKRGKIDDYLEMFNQFKVRVYFDNDRRVSYNNINDKFYGKNGNACKNADELLAFGDRIINRK